MRHRVYGKHLGRNKNQRTALFKSLVQSLLISGSIETTDTKAKAIKGLVDKLVNLAKSTTTQRLVSQFLTNKKISEKLIKEVAPALSTRSSGYTSIVKLGRRLGDNSMVVRMSLLVEEKTKPENKKIEKETVKIAADKSIEGKVEPKVKSPKKKIAVKK